MADEIKKPLDPVAPNVTIKNENSVIRKFIAQDIGSAFKAVLNDFLIPSVVRTTANFVKTLTDYVFFGKSAPTNTGYYDAYNNRYYNGGTVRNVTYGPSFNPTQGMNGPSLPSQNSLSIYAVNEIYFPDIGIPTDYLKRMKEIVSRYGMASVQDYYDILERPCPFTNNSYGWTDLTDAKVEGDLIRGYRIKFPRIVVLPTSNR